MWTQFFQDNLPDIKQIFIGGCGPGIRAYNLAVLYPKIDVIGLDSYINSINAAVHNLEKENVTFVHGNLLELPKSVTHMDLAIFNGVFHHMEEDQIFQVLQSMYHHGAQAIYINDYDSSQNNTSSNLKLDEWRKTRVEMGEMYPSYFQHKALVLIGHGPVKLHEALRFDSQLAAHHYETIVELLSKAGFTRAKNNLYSSQNAEVHPDSVEIFAFRD